MKFKSLILLVISLFILFSCDDGIKFDNPNDRNSDAYNPSDTEPDNDSGETDTMSEYDDEKTDTASTNDEEPISDDSDSDSTPDDADSIDDSGDSEPDESDSEDDSADSVPDDDSDSTDPTPDESDSTPDEDSDTDSGDSTPDEDADTDSGDSTPDQDTDTDTTPITPCDPNPCNGIANSTGVCTVSGTGYSCACNSGYFWNGQKCAVLPECSVTSGTPCKDSTSGLTWSKKAENTMAWQDAKNYCTSYTEGGLTGWQLPNIDELRTIFIADRASSCQVSEKNGHLSFNDYWTCETCTETGTPSSSENTCSDWGTSYSDGRYSKFGETGFLWSSSTRVDSTYFAWGVRFGSGYVGYGDKANSYDVRCVRCEDGYFWNGSICKKQITLGNICTGQSKCYNNSEEITCPTLSTADFYGQDAQYRNKCSTQSFTVKAVSGQNIVIDNNTGLEWQQAISEDTFKWDDAISHCENLSYAGKNDWRLPNPFELLTIIDSSEYAPAINQTYFPIENSDLWSSAAHANPETSNTWKVSYNAGLVDNDSRTKTLKVHCVRGNELKKSTFTTSTINSNVVVNDSVTGLMWQKTYVTGKTWKEALKYCEDLTYAGKSDWRLPNKNELVTLVNYGKFSPASDFPDMPSDAWFWASTTVPGEHYKAWRVYIANGSARGLINKTGTSYVRCVRNAE